MSFSSPRLRLANTRALRGKLAAQLDYFQNKKAAGCPAAFRELIIRLKDYALSA
jgi:hypothetical protein